MRQHRPDRRPGEHQRAADAGRHQHDDGTARSQQAAQRLADEGTDPAAGLAQGVEVGHDLVGTIDDVQQTEQRQARQSPADGQAEAIHAAALADQRSPDRDQGDGHHEPAETGEPADDGFDAAAQRTGEVEIDGQTEHDAGGDEPDSGELVFAPLDGLTELGRGLIAPGGRWRHRRDLGRGALRRGALGRGRLLGALAGVAPCRHRGSNGTKGALPKRGTLSWG
jgi:hypothetical protein